MWAPEGRTFWSEGRTHADAPEAGPPLVWARNTQEASKPRGEGDENREVAGKKLGGVRWVARPSASLLERGRTGSLSACLDRTPLIG